MRGKMASSTAILCPDVAAAFTPRGVVSRKFILYLKKQGHCNGVAAARAMSKLDLLVVNRVSRRNSVHKSPHVIEEDLATHVSEDVLPCPEREAMPLPATKQRERRDAMKLKAVSRVSVADLSGSLPPHVIYLLEEIGFDLEQIKRMARNDPYFACRSLEGKIRPLVEFLLDLGVSKSDIRIIMVNRPQLTGLRLSENVIPKIKFLETLGVDRTKWGQVITRFPALFTVSQQKVEATVEFLYEMGLSKESIGKILNQYPVIVGLSIEDQLRPKAEYFQSLGVDVAFLLHRSPQIMGYSMEAKLKAVTEFFLGNGFSIEEIGIMITGYTRLYTRSLKQNIAPKLEFFLKTDYSRNDLLKCPKYFHCSLEDRIKPRYKKTKELGVDLSLGRMLMITNDNFEALLQKKAEK